MILTMNVVFNSYTRDLPDIYMSKPKGCRLEGAGIYIPNAVLGLGHIISGKSQVAMVYNR